MNLTVLTPHFAPDAAPTGEVTTRIVQELAARGHAVHVVTSLPWYRAHHVEPGYEGRLVRHEDEPWGRVTRIHPLPSADKTDVWRRAAAFAAFSTLAAAAGMSRPRPDAVLALSPPLTLGAAGRVVAARHRAPFVFNVQDVYPDVAVTLGAVESSALVRAAHKLERWVYDHADAITVLSEDVESSLASRVNDPSKLHVIPNFVDTRAITPGERDNAYRQEFGLSGKVVVMYAGNVGFSQSVDLIPRVAASFAHDPDVMFVVNGGGAAKAEVETAARGLDNVTFVDPQPAARLPEVLAAADLHLVLLKRGLARYSVPSKVYSILAAGRPLVASVDPGTEVARIVIEAGAGVAVPPEDDEALVKAVSGLVGAPESLRDMGAAGRRWVETWPSAESVAAEYDTLFNELVRRPG